MRAALPLALLAALPARAALTRAQLDAAAARPAPAMRLPASVGFVDQHGRVTDLANVAAGRPLVLLFADFTCRHLCGPGLVLAAGSLHDAGLRPGTDYRLAVIGLDPRDSAADMRAFARRLDALPAERAATAFLRTTPRRIAAITQALGYGAVYDPTGDQFAHDASVYVFSADGRLAALLPELGLRPEMLRAALAGAAPTPSLGERVAHLCFGLDAATGRYDRGVVTALRAGTVLALAAGLVLALRRRRRAAQC